MDTIRGRRRARLPLLGLVLSLLAAAILSSSLLGFGTWAAVTAFPPVVAGSRPGRRDRFEE